MKKKLTIASVMLGLSVVAGSAYAASNDMGDTTKSSEPTNLEEMAKEQGVTLNELIAQLEKEGKLTKAVSTTESIPAEGSVESNMTSEMTSSNETVNLETMAKEQGITVDELIAKLKKEGKLMKAEVVTESISTEKNGK
ncbi:hypothetical protein [Psychrobacillus sp.]|uniref:hypothetical protein n=1 Tax=Psychrobacillus sp. TaxID=1871623 RepID=UPI0028BE665F|nr:hypothetical protein [Psychrobacillus sp.]